MRVCSRCGLRSEAGGDFFRKEKEGVFGFRRSVCDGCRPYKPTRGQRASLFALFWFPFYWVFPFSGAFGTGSANLELGTPMFFAIAFTVGALTLPLQTAIHEAGHALAAKARRRFVLSVEIGAGPTIARWRLGPTRILVGRYFFYGGLTRFCGINDQKDFWGDLLILSAGVLANFAVGIPLILIAPLFNDLFGGWGRVLSATCIGFGGAQILIAAINLLPFKGRTTPDHPNGLMSDGLAIVRRLRPQSKTHIDARVARVLTLDRMGRYGDAAELALNAPPDSPYRAWFWTQALHELAHGGNAPLALATYRALADRIEALPQPNSLPDKEARAGLYANVVWIIASARAADLDDIGERYSSMAIKARPKWPATRAARGAWLATHGKPLAGAKLMTRALRGLESPRERADLAGFLARTWAALNDVERAKGFSDLQAHMQAQI